MYQASLFDDIQLKNIVNVASVPQRSPFRYPGGKTWLVPHIRRWLGSKPARPGILIEPFAGGGIIGLTAAAEKLVDKVLLVELDDEVASVWRTVLDDGEWLAEQVANFDFTPDTVAATLSYMGGMTREKAFRTLLKNRVNRGGILAPGAGLVKQGENGKGLQSRWYPTTLRNRILSIASMKDRITFVEGDGLDVLRRNAERPDMVYFIDPPYTAAGKRAGSRLYKHSDLDHEELFRLASELAGDFLMTYDHADEIREVSRKHGFDTLLVAMKNTHHAKMNELLIGRDLNWTRS